MYYSENWEDMDGFIPEVYQEVTSEDIALWEEMCSQYALFRGGVSTFRYRDYYRAMAQVRGCEELVRNMQSLLGSRVSIGGGR